MSSPLSGFSKEDEGFSTKVNKAGQWAAHGASKSCVQSGGEKGSAESFFAAGVGVKLGRQILEERYLPFLKPWDIVIGITRIDGPWIDIFSRSQVMGEKIDPNLGPYNPESRFVSSPWSLLALLSP